MLLYNHSHHYDFTKLSGKKSMLCRSCSLFLLNRDDGVVLFVTPKSNLECVQWEECAGISPHELTGGNGDPSIHKFPGNLPRSSPPQICLASGFTPQPLQRCTETEWWHCFPGLGSSRPRHFINLTLRINPVRGTSTAAFHLHQSCVMSSA